MLTLAPDRHVDGGTAFRYSVVRRIENAYGGNQLIVENPQGVRTRLDISCPSDPEAANDLRSTGLRPLAVKLDVREPGAISCTALFTSAKGPQRRPIPMGAALAFCRDGVRTIVTQRR